MYEVTDYSNEGIAKWAAEQLEYANTIGENNVRYNCARLIVEHALRIRSKVLLPAGEAEKRKHELIVAKIAKWRADHPNVEPQIVKINEEAYRESHPDIAKRIDEIIDLRTQAESL